MVLFVYVVMFLIIGVNIIFLEFNVVIVNEVYDVVGVDDIDYVEFDLDELKEQFGIDSIFDKFNDFVVKFCSEKFRIEYFGLEV